MINKWPTPGEIQDKVAALRLRPDGPGYHTAVDSWFVHVSELEALEAELERQGYDVRIVEGFPQRDNYERLHFVSISRYLQDDQPRRRPSDMDLETHRWPARQFGSDWWNS